LKDIGNAHPHISFRLRAFAK